MMTAERSEHSLGSPHPTDNGPLPIEVRGLCVRDILFDVSFAIKAGEKLAIVGPNGSGKTTLLQAIHGRRSPDAGVVLLGCRPVHRVGHRERARQFAVVSQTDAPDGRFTVQDYVALGRFPHQRFRDLDADRSVVDAALEACALHRFASRPLESLSGGERQRALLARALAQQPGVLMVDEPTNHLDLAARSGILRLLGSLEITVIAVLHDLALVSSFADRVAVLRHGRLAACGTAETAFSPALVRDVFGLDCNAVTLPGGNSQYVFSAIAGASC